MIDKERARIAQEEADRLKHLSDAFAAPSGAKPETETRPDRQEQPETVPV
ncbi:MAG: hypothetical protein ACM3IK_08605 [Sphingomonadaceae bacterium]